MKLSAIIGLTEEKGLIQNMSYRNQYQARNIRTGMNTVRRLNKRSGSVSAFIAWDPSAARGFLWLGSGPLKQFLEDPIVQQRMMYHIENSSITDPDEPFQVIESDHIDIVIPHDWIVQNSEMKNEYIMVYHGDN